MMTMLTPDGSRAEVRAGGWEHFSDTAKGRRKRSTLTLLPSIDSALQPTLQNLCATPQRSFVQRLTRPAPGEPLHSGPVFAAPYHTPGDPSDTPYTYARSHNPTWTSLEKAIGQMESGEGYRASALVFASGMAACAAVFGAVLTARGRSRDAIRTPTTRHAC